MRNSNKQTKAFTMIELVFVIVVLGILAALAIPRMDRDLRQEAKDNLLSAIRYTQHLALNDDKTDPFDSTWQSKLWNISFSSDGSDYNISSDTNVAIDPTNGKLMDSTGSSNVLIGKKYSVNNISSAGCGLVVAFDHLGRPFDGVAGGTSDYANYMNTNTGCVLTVTFASSSIDPLVLTIAKETGYVSGD